MTSMYIFATLGPAVLTFLVMWFVGRHVARGKTFGGLDLAWRSVAAGLLVPVGVAILSVPSSLFSGHIRAQAVIFSVEIALFALIAAPILLRQWHGRVRSAAPNVFLAVFGPIYLGVLAALWISAPASARTAEGLAYAAVCFVLAGLGLVMALTAGREVKEAKGPVTRAGAQV